MPRLRLLMTIALGVVLLGFSVGPFGPGAADAGVAVGGDSLTVAAQPGAETTVDATAVALVSGGNLIGWFGLDTTSTAILDGNADLTTVWVFAAGAWESDSTLLPDALRPSIAITRGMGLFIVTSAATDLMVPTGITFSTDVFPFSDPTLDQGDATFTRTLDGASISADADSLTPGNAYTMWWVIWNDPTQCAVVCGEPDLGVDGNTVLYAGGAIASEAGTASFTWHLSVGGPVPAAVIPGALTNPIEATIHLVLRDHGPALTGDALITQLTEFEPTAADAASVGDGFAFDVFAAVNDGPNTPLTAAIAAVDDSGVSGTATLRASGDGTAIQVTVAGLSEGVHANHLHHGSCAELGPIHVPLSDLSAGADGDASGATVWPDNGLDHFASDHYFAVHELVTFAVIGCGDVQ